MPLFFKSYGELLYRGVVLIAICGFYVGQSKAEFVTKTDLAAQLTAAVTPVSTQVLAVAVQVTALDKSLAVLVEQNRVTERHEQTIKELDARLRALEARR